MSARVLWIWLATRRGVPAHMLNRLLLQFGTPEAIYAAERRALAVTEGMLQAYTDSLSDKALDEAQMIADTCEKQEISILTIADSGYPERLRQIPDPPIVLYIRGVMPDFDKDPGIAVVGTRHATSYGIAVAQQMAEELSEAGFLIVSGMAEGVDGAAARGALKACGRTVAVLGCGVDRCYPMMHQNLRDDILLSGAVISEYPPGAPPASKHFPVRNRIICGLCLATIVIEAPLRSGALITAHTALDQGRDVFAVPGNLDAPNSVGTNRLIASGEAALLCSAKDIICEYSGLLRELPEDERIRRALGRQIGHKLKEQTEVWKAVEPLETQGKQQLFVESQQKQEDLPETSNLTQEESKILQAIQKGAGVVDEVAEKTDLPAGIITAGVTMLELSGHIIRRNGRWRGLLK